MMCRYADDFVCAFRYRDDAESFYRMLPKRLGKYGLEVARKARPIRISPDMLLSFEKSSADPADLGVQG